MFKILEQNGIDNENIDGGAFNNFAAGNRDGVLGGVLSECALAAEGNTVSIGTGVLIIHGIRVKIEATETIALSSFPNTDTRYQIVARINLVNKIPSFSLDVRSPSTVIQDELYQSNNGIYEVEIGRFTHSREGRIIELTRTIDTIYGASPSGALSIGDVQAYDLDPGMPPEADVTKRMENGKELLDFSFGIPKAAGSFDPNGNYSGLGAGKLILPSAVGSSTQPVYFSADGVPVACGDSLAVSITGNAETATTATNATNATNAVNAQTATNAQQLGGVLADEYALKTGNYDEMTVGNAKNAENSERASSAATADVAKSLAPGATIGNADTAKKLSSSLLISNNTNEENWYEIISVNFEQGYVVNDTVLISGIFTQNNMQGFPAKNGYTKNSHFGILNISCVAKGTINGIDPQNNSWELINIRLIGGDIPDSFLAYYITDDNDIKICVKTNSAYVNVFSFIQSGTLLSSVNSSAVLVSETPDFVSIPHHLPFLGSDQNIIKINSVQSVYPGASYIIDVVPDEGNVGPEIGDYIIDANGNVFIALESNNPVAAPETLSYCTGLKIPFYVKPSTGIGTSDLSSYVVQSLIKANSALQKAPVVPDGTYEAMTVGKALSATNAENADSSKKSNKDSDGNIITDTYAAYMEFSIDPKTYVLTLALKSKNNATLITKSIDLPLETMVVGASYDDSTKKIILSLQNGETISFSVSELVNGLVTDTQLSSEINARETADNALESSISNILNGNSVVSSAEHSENSDRAVSDGDGNNIVNTYVTKANANSVSMVPYGGQATTLSSLESGGVYSISANGYLRIAYQTTAADNFISMSQVDSSGNAMWGALSNGQKSYGSGYPFIYMPVAAGDHIKVDFSSSVKILQVQLIKVKTV